jgi:hypothetical protein
LMHGKSDGQKACFLYFEGKAAQSNVFAPGNKSKLSRSKTTQDVKTQCSQVRKEGGETKLLHHIANAIDNNAFHHSCYLKSRIISYKQDMYQ